MKAALLFVSVFAVTCRRDEKNNISAVVVVFVIVVIKAFLLALELKDTAYLLSLVLWICFLPLKFPGVRRKDMGRAGISR